MWCHQHPLHHNLSIPVCEVLRRTQAPMEENAATKHVRLLPIWVMMIIVLHTNTTIPLSCRITVFLILTISASSGPRREPTTCCSGQGIFAESSPTNTFGTFFSSKLLMPTTNLTDDQRACKIFELCWSQQFLFLHLHIEILLKFLYIDMINICITTVQKIMTVIVLSAGL